ncbi:hypothetical protein GGP41_006616 [Bipolaris sorokiniana]|uniref:Secreted protein n=1 Tax=Cochliobolus sativus TaxID=45130 RepID=A0A8H5ZTX7_COCSA|nr:hypothetical protein GGP41_006616 [Bipolaris sorokiniana]
MKCRFFFSSFLPFIPTGLGTFGDSSRCFFRGEGRVSFPEGEFLSARKGIACNLSSLSFWENRKIDMRSVALISHNHYLLTQSHYGYCNLSYVMYLPHAINGQSIVTCLCVSTCVCVRVCAKDGEEMLGMRSTLRLMLEGHRIGPSPPSPPCLIIELNA